MPSLADGDAHRVVHDGAHIAVRVGGSGESEQAVGIFGGSRVRLHVGYQPGETLDELTEYAGLDGGYFLFRTHDFLLIFLELWSDVAFRADESLLAYPVFGHLLLMGVAHLDIIAEHVVESDFERRYSCLFRLASLNIDKRLLAARVQAAQFVEFGVNTLGDCHAASELSRGIGVHGGFESVDYGGAVSHLGRKGAQSLRVALRQCAA